MLRLLPFTLHRCSQSAVVVGSSCGARRWVASDGGAAAPSVEGGEARAATDGAAAKEASSSGSKDSHAASASTSGEPQRPALPLKTSREGFHTMTHNMNFRVHGDLSYEIGMVGELRRRQDLNLELLLAQARLRTKQQLAARPLTGTLLEEMPYQNPNV